MQQTGLSRTDLVVLAGIMAVLVVLVLALAPQPVVHVEIKEVKVTTEDPESITIAPKSLVISPESLTIAPKEFTFSPGDVKVEVPQGRPPPPVPQPTGFEGIKAACLNNVRQIAGLLEITMTSRYPRHSGANLLVYLVKKGELYDEDSIRLLFCPGDKKESFEQAGGLKGFENIDLKQQGVHDHLTSYAGRDQRRKTCAVRKGQEKQVVLVCDDSADHHEGKGIVVGLTGGMAKWRDKVADYKLAADDPFVVGEDSKVEELTCMRSD